VTALLASAYQDMWGSEMWGSPLAPLYLLLTYAGIVASVVYGIYQIARWTRSEIHDLRWSRTRKRRAAELKAAAVSEEA
jgi:hypothetical protein